MSIIPPPSAANGPMAQAIDDVMPLLDAARSGDPDAVRALFPLVYDELRAVARRQRRRWQGDATLDTTALVHEAYLRLVGAARTSWESRAHFLAVAATAMRRILINYARDGRTQRRGGGAARLSLDEIAERIPRELALDGDADVLDALEEALVALERENARQCRIVECRFFAGMTLEETAAALGISTATVSRGWAVAQVRLYQHIQRTLGV